MRCDSNSKLKVLHIISGDLWAGAEAMAFNLLKNFLNNDDLEISVILLNKGQLADELKSLGIDVDIIDENIHSFFGVVREIRKIVLFSRPHIIHSHRYKENILAFIVSRMIPGIKLVSTLHGLPEYIATKPNLFQSIKTRVNFFILARCFYTVSVSEDIRHTLLNGFRFNEERIEVIHNGVELPKLQSFEPIVSEEKFVVGSSGRLFAVKDYPLMIEIAREVNSLVKTGFHFELAGNGPELNMLESLVNTHGLTSTFIFKGHLEDMASFYKGLDVYINTSFHEGIPMTILEALSYGLPVIAPAVGGIGEIYDDGVEGFLIHGRDPQNFATKCLQLYAEREMRERMSKAARMRAEQEFFSAEKMAESYYQIYQQK